MELASLVALGGGGQEQQPLALREDRDELAAPRYAVAPNPALAPARQSVTSGHGAAAIAERRAADLAPADLGLARHAARPRPTERGHVGRWGGNHLLPGRVLVVALRHARELRVVPERDGLDVVGH